MPLRSSWQPARTATLDVCAVYAGRGQELSALQKHLAASKDSHAALDSQLRELNAQAGDCTGQLQALEALHQGSEGRARREAGRALELEAALKEATQQEAGRAAELEAALQEAAHLLHALQVRSPVPPSCVMVAIGVTLVLAAALIGDCSSHGEALLHSTFPSVKSLVQGHRLLPSSVS